MVPLGLYRSSAAQNSPMPYVFTSPLPETILHSEDKVYVLAQELFKRKNEPSKLLQSLNFEIKKGHLFSVPKVETPTNNSEIKETTITSWDGHNMSDIAHSSEESLEYQTSNTDDSKDESQDSSEDKI